MSARFLGDRFSGDRSGDCCGDCSSGDVFSFSPTLLLMRRHTVNQ